MDIKGTQVYLANVYSDQIYWIQSETSGQEFATDLARLGVRYDDLEGWVCSLVSWNELFTQTNEKNLSNMTERLYIHF